MRNSRERQRTAQQCRGMKSSRWKSLKINRCGAGSHVFVIHISPRCTLSSSKLTRILELRCQDQLVRFMPLIWRQLASIQEWFLNKDDMTKYHGRSGQFTQPMNPCGSLILEVSEWVDAEEEEIIKRGGNVEKVFPVKGHKFVPTVKFCGIIVMTLNDWQAFRQPVFCAMCEKFIWGFGKQVGLLCLSWAYQICF